LEQYKKPAQHTTHSKAKTLPVLPTKKPKLVPQQDSETLPGAVRQAVNTAMV
jgi:hypothetical protein